MFKVLVDGVDQYRIEDIDMSTITDTLPVATYSVGFNALQGYFFLKKIDDFKLPSRLYGNEIERADRVLETFLDRPNGTGVVLAGEKGSGKTLLAKKVSVNAAAMGIPTIVVNNAYCGEVFNKFMQSILQPCVVLFDEFEKVYNAKEQEAMLTLLDGTMSSKKLWMVTINDVYKIDDFMKNRPGRFFYMFRYGGISADVIREYCADVLNNKSQTESIVAYAHLFNAFTFDMLTAIVEEMNRYNEPLRDVVEMVNANYEFDGGISFEIMAANITKFEDCKYENYEILLKRSYVHGEINPLNDEFTVVVYYEYPSGENEDGSPRLRQNYEQITFSPDDMLNTVNGVFTFENDRATISMKKKVTKARRFHY